MIDDMMGNVPGDANAGLLPPTRKNVHSYTDIGNYMNWWAKRLEEIAMKDIPKAFPFSPPKGGTDPRFNHSQWELMGAGFSAEISDGLYAIGTVNDMLNILIPARFVLTSLFPPTFDNGRMEIEIPDKFEEAKQLLLEVISGLKKLQSELEHNTQGHKNEAIDRKEMEKIDNHFIRLGFDFLKDGKIPQELFNKNINTNPEVIARERMMLESANILPNMNAVLLEPNAEEDDVESIIMDRFKGWLP